MTDGRRTGIVTSVHLRATRTSDLPLLRTWLDEDARDFLGDDWPSTVRRAFSDDERSCYTVEDDGEPLAIVWVRPDEHSSTIWFERLVAPYARGRGVGRFLVCALAREEAMRPFAAFGGDVSEHNARCRANLHALGFDSLVDAPEPDAYEVLTVFAAREHVAALPY